MDLKRGNRIWESENRNFKLEIILKDFVGDLEKISKSKRDSYILKFFREIIEENRILEGFNE